MKELETIETFFIEYLDGKVWMPCYNKDFKVEKEALIALKELNRTKKITEQPTYRIIKRIAKFYLIKE